MAPEDERGSSLRLGVNGMGQTHNNYGRDQNIFNNPSGPIYIEGDGAPEPLFLLPIAPSDKFVGRESVLGQLHDKLISQDVAVSAAIAGMGGVGKTELALQYAQKHRQDYPGGVCWITVRDSDVAARVLEIAERELGLEVPQEHRGEPVSLDEQVAWCWRNWRPQGTVLLVWDDVPEGAWRRYKHLLPKDRQRFRLLVTTRERELDARFWAVPLETLTLKEALKLLVQLIALQ